MIDLDPVHDASIERREDQVAIILPIGPATITVEVPKWAVPIAVRSLREGFEDAAEDYHELLDELEDKANGS